MKCFTKQLNSDIIPPQKLYFQGNRLAQVYHTRQRTGCINLRLHLYSKTLLKLLCVTVVKLKTLSTFLV